MPMVNVKISNCGFLRVLILTPHCLRPPILSRAPIPTACRWEAACATAEQKSQVIAEMTEVFWRGYWG